MPRSSNPKPTQGTVRAGPRSGADGEGLEKASCRVCRASCNRPFEVRMLGGLGCVWFPLLQTLQVRAWLGCIGAAHAQSSSQDQIQIPFVQLATIVPKTNESSRWRGKKKQSDRVFISGATPSTEWKLPGCQINLQMIEASLERLWEAGCYTSADTLAGFSISNLLLATSKLQMQNVRKDERKKVRLKARACMSFYAEYQPIATIQNWKLTNILKVQNVL